MSHSSLEYLLISIGEESSQLIIVMNETLTSTTTCQEQHVPLLNILPSCGIDDIRFFDFSPTEVVEKSDLTLTESFFLIYIGIPGTVFTFLSRRFKAKFHKSNC